MCNLTGEPLQANVLEHIEDIILNIKDRYETFAVVPKAYISETIVLDAQFGPLNH